jgi:hypothetical protein
MIFSLNHFVQALITQVRIESTLDNREEILRLITTALLVKFDTSIEPSNRPPHSLFYPRAGGQAGY